MRPSADLRSKGRKASMTETAPNQRAPPSPPPASAFTTSTTPKVNSPGWARRRPSPIAVDFEVPETVSNADLTALADDQVSIAVITGNFDLNTDGELPGSIVDAANALASYWRVGQQRIVVARLQAGDRWRGCDDRILRWRFPSST